jgi:hypothetical protein
MEIHIERWGKSNTNLTFKIKILPIQVMQVKGKDYCFHKGVGEAEW